VPISAAMQEEADGVEPVADFAQSLLPKRRLGTAQSWLRTNTISEAPQPGAEGTVRATSEVAIHQDITFGDEAENIE